MRCINALQMEWRAGRGGKLQIYKYVDFEQVISDTNSLSINRKDSDTSVLLHSYGYQYH